MEDQQKKMLMLAAGGCVALACAGMCVTGAALFLLAKRAPVQGPGPSTGTAPTTGTEPATHDSTSRKPGYARGHVTGEDGKPVHVPGAKIKIMIYGAIGDGYQPPVDADGYYETKVTFDVYHGIKADIEFMFNGKLYTCPLHPVQDNTGDWTREDGVVQDFVWKLSGQRPGTQPDPANFTAWYGASVHMGLSTWREDLKKGIKAAPEGTKVTVTVVPKGPLADGSQGKTLTFERHYDRLLASLDLNGTVPTSRSASTP